jgi:hypothetical protein
MTLIITFIVAHLGAFATAGGALIAVVVAWFHGNSTGKAKAQDEAKAAIGAAQSQTAVAQQQAAQSAADTEEAQKTVAAVQVAAQAQADAHAMTSDELDAKAAKLGILRKD